MHESETCFHNLEAPAAGTLLAPGWQRVRGWLVPKPGFHFVDVRVVSDGRVFPGVYGFPRADLAAHFEPTRRWLPAEYTVDVELKAGPVNFAIEALSLTGRWEKVQAVAGEAKGEPIAGVTHDPLCAEEFALALQLSLKQPPAETSVASSLPYPSVLRANHPPFHGFIDEPATIAPAWYGRLPVLGWLFHETLTIKQAYVSTDLLTFQRLEIGGEFPGVKERFSRFPAAANCRLFGFVDVSSQLPSPVSARFYAELEDGSTQLCLAVQCRPVTTEEIKAAYPYFSALRFWRSWRTLRRQLAARKIPLETGRNYLSRVWQAFLRYRREAPPCRPSRKARILPLLKPSATAKPRLLLITHNLNFEGAPLLFVELARHLATHRGARLLVFSGQDGPLRNAFTELGAEVRIVDVSPLLAARSAAELRGHAAALAQTLDRREIDAVVANTLFCFWGIHLARALRRPSLLSIHESTNPAIFFEGKIQPRVLSAVHDAFEEATAVSFNTPATRAYYQAGASGDNFQLTSAWIDLSAIAAFRAQHAPAELRDRLQLKPGERLVINVGSVCDRKGQHDFLRAIEWFWRQQPALAAQCRFVMVGGRDNPYNRFLEQNRLGLDRPNLQIIPETDRVYDYFGAAEMFVCTSYEESFPRVVMEAMAFEVPIVSTHVHGIAYLLRADEDALLVKPGDVAALATAMHQVLQESAEAKARAKKARERVQEFSAALVLPHHAALISAVSQAEA